MGGQGSGRKPDPMTQAMALAKQTGANPSVTPNMILPNLSGVRDMARKDKTATETDPVYSANTYATSMNQNVTANSIVHFNKVEVAPFIVTAASGSPTCTGSYTYGGIYNGYPYYSKNGFYLYASNGGMYRIGATLGEMTNAWYNAQFATPQIEGTLIGTGTFTGTSVLVTATASLSPSNVTGYTGGLKAVSSLTNSIKDTTGATTLASYSAGVWTIDSSVVYAAAGVPSGVICMWSGLITAVPTGWVLCDGNNSTPDLRDKFIVGAGSAYNIGDSGGSDSHEHTVPTSDTGYAVVSDSGHDHGIPSLALGLGYGSTLDDTGGGIDINGSTNTGVTDVGYTNISDGGHDHSFSSTTGSENNLPPYYALAFIMKS